MKNIAVIYKSKYGATKQYAMWIAKELDAPLLEASTIDPSQLDMFDVIIYGGGLYAGRINGIELVMKSHCELLVIFSVGLANPKNEDYSAMVDSYFTQDLLSKTKVFHLLGSINYKKLSIVHRGMMVMVKSRLRKKEESEWSGEDRLFLETYGTKVSFINKNTIGPLVAFIKNRT